jgi:uncharacterized membrane protein
LRGSKYLALLLAGIGTTIVILAMLTPSGHTGGSGTGSTNYPFSSLVLGIAGAFMAAMGFSYFFLKEEYEPYVQPSSRPESPPEARAVMSAQTSTQPAVAQAPSAAAVIDAEEGELVLRLLTGDERVMFKMILDSGGEALQKDLIIKTKMSDAKVSRTIDRLVEKGLIVKERYGVTNKVRIIIDK